MLGAGVGGISISGATDSLSCYTCIQESLIIILGHLLERRPNYRLLSNFMKH